MAQTVIPTQKRYRDWEDPIGSKNSMESLSIVTGIGNKQGFDWVGVSMTNNSNPTNINLTIGSLNNLWNASTPKGRYNYLVDRLQVRRDIGGVVVTPDGILTEVDQALVLDVNSPGGFNSFNYYDGDRDREEYVEILLIATHNYIEEKLGDANGTSFRLIYNSNGESIKSSIGLDQYAGISDTNRTMRDWLNHPAILGNLDPNTEVIVGLYSICIQDGHSEIVIPHNYEWPTKKVITQSMWDNIDTRVSDVEVLPKTTKLRLVSRGPNSSLPTGKVKLDKAWGNGDSVEVYLTNLAQAWNNIRDVMSIWEKDADISTAFPKIQIIFNQSTKLAIAKVNLLQGDGNDKYVAVEYSYGSEFPSIQLMYLLAPYQASRVCKVNLITKSITFELQPTNVAGVPNTITVHVDFTWADQSIQTRNSHTVWVTSEHPVTSELTCKVTGTYITDVSTPNSVNLNHDFVIPVGLSTSPTLFIDEIYAEPPTPQTPADWVLNMTPNSDDNWEYVPAAMIEFHAGQIQRQDLTVNLHVEENTNQYIVKTWATVSGSVHSEVNLTASGNYDVYDQALETHIPQHAEAYLAVPIGASISNVVTYNYARNFQPSLTNVLPKSDDLFNYLPGSVIHTTV